LDLNKIVEHIKQKKFVVTRHGDANMANRKQKMFDRGWQCLDLPFPVYVPNRGENAGAELALVPSQNPDYIKYSTLFSNVLNTSVSSIHEVSNSNLTRLYLAMRDSINRENNGNANEVVLFHGTSDVGASGIQEWGFDDRFWNAGNFGIGAYFADDIRKSNTYAPASNGKAYIFVCRVILGKQQVVSQTNANLFAPDKGYHSIKGQTNYNEFIVYRYGQAIPYWKITYNKQ